MNGTTKVIREVKEPIFFIGVPRSGTTIVFEAFSSHHDLVWFSNKLSKHPSFPIISIFSRIGFLNSLRGAKQQGPKQFKLRHHLPRPAECYNVWEACCGSKFLYDYLIDQVATEKENHNTIRFISRVIRYHGKKRFAAKITGPSKIHYLNSIFPDAKFIHVIRNPKAVVHSLMNVRFWKARGGYSEPWWKNGLTKEDFATYEHNERSPVALAAIQWRRIVKVARNEASKISEKRYYEMKYEDFITAPNEHMERLFTFSGLENSRKANDYLNKFVQLKNQNYKYLQSMHPRDCSLVDDIDRDLLSALNYD